MSNVAPPPADGLTYEQARDELVRIVAKLEEGSASLDESIALWERGEVLALRCQSLLEGARAKLAAKGESQAEDE